MIEQVRQARGSQEALEPVEDDEQTGKRANV